MGYKLLMPDIFEITVKGKITECIISEVVDFDCPVVADTLISHDKALIKRVKSYLNLSRYSPDKIHEQDQEVNGYGVVCYDLGGEYVKRYNPFFMLQAYDSIKNINGIEYKGETKYYYRENSDVAGKTYQEVPVTYKKISFVSQYKYINNNNQLIEGSELEFIVEALKNQCFIKYDPLLHPIIKRRDSGNNRQ